MSRGLAPALRALAQSPAERWRFHVGRPFERASRGPGARRLSPRHTEGHGNAGLQSLCIQANPLHGPDSAVRAGLDAWEQGSGRGARQIRATMIRRDRRRPVAGWRRAQTYGACGRRHRRIDGLTAMSGYLAERHARPRHRPGRRAQATSIREPPEAFMADQQAPEAGLRSILASANAGTAGSGTRPRGSCARTQSCRDARSPPRAVFRLSDAP